MCKKAYHKFFNMCSVSFPNPISTSAQFHYQIQKKRNEFCNYDTHDRWTKWAHYTKILLKKTMEVYMIKKLTISFGTCAQFHCQIQNKKKEFCHYDIHEGWTERAHCTKMLLNKTVHVYMYKKTYHKLFYMCSVSLPNPKKKKKISSVIKIYMRDEPSGHITPKYCWK